MQKRVWPAISAIWILSGFFDRTTRRAGVPVAYSQGFHPHPKFSFGPPLTLGFSSIAEYVDISLSTPFPGFEQALISNLPDGFRFMEAKSVPDRTGSLSDIITLAEYTVSHENIENIDKRIDEILKKDDIFIIRVTKKGEKTVNIKPGIKEIQVIDSHSFSMILSIDKDTAVKPSEVLNMLFGERERYQVTRAGQYAVPGWH